MHNTLTGCPRIKKSILLFFFALIQLSTYSQHYIPLPDSDAYWRVDWTLATCPYGGSYARYQYFSRGDTIISALHYTKLYRSGICNECCQAPYSPQDGYLGSYRQDTIAKRVFYTPNGQTQEQLLYDFSLKVGDTIKGFLCSMMGGQVISSIDSILLDSIYHRRLNWGVGIGTLNFIEGIGSAQGFLEPIINFDPPGWLICLSVSGKSVYYQNFQLDSCELINSVNPNNEIPFNLKISPNPFSSIVSFEFNKPNVQEFQIEIYNTGGEQIKHCDIKGNYFKFDLSYYCDGIYFYRIFIPSLNRLFTGKLIKSGRLLDF